VLIDITRIIKKREKIKTVGSVLLSMLMNGTEKCKLMSTPPHPTTP
jgi:hypothetical protein